MYRSYFVIISILILFVSCSTPPEFTQQISNQKIPLHVIFEKEIKGQFFGILLNGPYGLTVDMKGNIFVSDYGNDRLLKFDTAFKAIAYIGGAGRQEGLLDKPTFLEMDNGLNLLVSEEGNRRISRYDAQLNFVDIIDFYDFDDQTKFGTPSGIAVADFGELWVCDKEKNRIAVFNSFGSFERFVGDFGTSGGQLRFPEKIVRLKGNSFAICDSDNGRLVIYDEYGNYETGIKFDKDITPTALIAEGHNFWVLDSYENKIYYVNQAGNILFELGPNLPGDDLSLREPTDLIRLKDNKLLIADRGNNRLIICKIFRE